MFKSVGAYLIKDCGLVVFDKSKIDKGDEFEEITILMPMSKIIEWAEEADFMKKDIFEE